MPLTKNPIRKKSYECLNRIKTCGLMLTFLRVHVWEENTPGDREWQIAEKSWAGSTIDNGKPERDIPFPNIGMCRNEIVRVYQWPMRQSYVRSVCRVKKNERCKDAETTTPAGRGP